MAKFPKLHLVCLNDKLRPILGHVAVIDNKMVAADTHAMVVIPIEYYTDYPGMADNIDGKLIHSSTIKKMCATAVKNLTFLRDSIILDYGVRKEKLFYAGVRDTEKHGYSFAMRNIETGEAIMQEITTGEGEVKKIPVRENYPQYKQVIPDFDEKPESFPFLGVGPEKLDNISKCFYNSVWGISHSVKLSFTENLKHTEADAYPKRGIKVEPASKTDLIHRSNKDQPKEKELGMIMPIILK